MELNLLILKEFFEKEKGTFVIDLYQRPARLIGLIDTEFDYYYVTFDGRDVRANTCVGRLIPLKNRIDEDDYARMVNRANFNHYDRLYLEYKFGSIEDLIIKFKEEFEGEWIEGPYLTIN